MAVRTGGSGPGGISLLIVPLLGHPGVTMRRITTGGAACSGTTFIELDDVKVPVENLIANVCAHSLILLYVSRFFEFHTG
jgi:acyl-CoA dehydrogenase